MANVQKLRQMADNSMHLCLSNYFIIIITIIIIIWAAEMND